MATLFLILVSETTVTEVESIKAFAKVGFFTFLVFVYCSIKRKTTRKIVN